MLHQHINFLELQTVLLTIQQFQQLVQGHHVIVMTDNTAVVGHIKNQARGTHSQDLLALTQELFPWTDSHEVTLSARHISGHLNVIADRLPRAHQILPTEWSLCPQIAHQMWKLWGQPHVDLFATAKNTKLRLFISPLQEPMVWARDALSFFWTGMWAYAFPPFPLLRQVLEKVSRDPCEMILITPAWPTQSWFPLLLQLSANHPCNLPTTKCLLLQPGHNLFHNLVHLHLHTWKLSSREWLPEASPRMWLR